VAEYRLSPAAQGDLEGIFDYTVQQWGLNQALRYTQLIEQACAALACGDMPAQDCSYLRAGYCRSAVERHVIYFRTETYGIAVIRILHARMDAPRHL
jgi:toxin ParE1/3/4